MLEKSAIIEIIIQLLSWLVFVICGFIKDFLANFYFILLIYHAKSFKMRHGMSLYLNVSVRYLLNALKTQNYYPDLIDFKYAPTLCCCFVMGWNISTRIYNKMVFQKIVEASFRCGIFGFCLILFSQTERILYKLRQLSSSQCYKQHRKKE